MKVKDLLNSLSKIDPEMDILCYSEDESFLPKNHLFRIFEIEELKVIEGEKIRGNDGIPTIKLGQSQGSQKHATLTVTSFFNK